VVVSVLRLAFGIARWEKNQTMVPGAPDGLGDAQSRQHGRLPASKGWCGGGCPNLPAVEELLKRVHSSLTINAVQVIITCFGSCDLILWLHLGLTFNNNSSYRQGQKSSAIVMGALALWGADPCYLHKQYSVITTICLINYILFVP
jgi:hypothetical protein